MIQLFIRYPATIYVLHPRLILFQTIPLDLDCSDSEQRHGVQLAGLETGPRGYQVARAVRHGVSLSPHGVCED